MLRDVVSNKHESAILYVPLVCCNHSVHIGSVRARCVAMVAHSVLLPAAVYAYPLARPNLRPKALHMLWPMVV
ncbi:hypothetical protein M408DRAFT_238455 [Serendipita vermifera MAFF 305830]|uniref:Uncharacterized protein n=1 Tax=Serendipita vermifera MAFF 305830 TaxID=933852 RepID=A0A0C3BJY2_SERVB|nr:hypothetical protein M408DRAFT_238455 [Serendipita vermifera MAFF 305830]